MKLNVLHVGDCIEVLRTLPSDSIDSIVTDPPYGLTQNRKGGAGVKSVNLNSPAGRSRIGTGNGAGGFMGLKWDSTVPPVAVWEESLRVLKPGGHMLVFSGTRTQHRMATNIEDAGFEIRDMIAWLYGSGFPKSLNVGKAIGEKEWDGWGTALKPAMEPITVARKPFHRTVSENVNRHGTGALNIDGCRVPSKGGRDRENEPSQNRRYANKGATSFAALPGPRGGAPNGRWPANIIHDGSEQVVRLFPESKGQICSVSGREKSKKTKNVLGAFGNREAFEARADSGSAARFFYCAKASKKERGPDNNHPTVKPLELMRYLVRLVTPGGGVVLDPFVGSGTTAVAAKMEGFAFIGIDFSKEYCVKAKRRLDLIQQATSLLDEVTRNARKKCR